MNLERAAMKGKLAELQETERRLRLKIEGTATAIRTGLNTMLIPVHELAVPELDEQWDALKTAWAELSVVLADITRLERELR
jgi:hypothetical protein